MRKFIFGFLAVTIIMSAAGLLLRLSELDNVFDPVTGLAYAWSAVSIVLMIISFVAAAAIFFFAFMLRASAIGGDGAYSSAFGYKTPVPLTLSVVLAAGMIYAAYDYYRYLRVSEVSMLAESILALFAVAAGIAFLTLTINAFRKKGGAEMILSCFVIVIFICYWLIITYKQRAADPVILDYAYDALALCASALAAYYVTGFCYNKGKIPFTLFFAGLSVYFCSVAIAGASPLAIKLFYGFVIAIMLIWSLTLGLNLKEAEIAEPENTLPEI